METVSKKDDLAREKSARGDTISWVLGLGILFVILVWVSTGLTSDTPVRRVDSVGLYNEYVTKSKSMYPYEAILLMARIHGMPPEKIMDFVVLGKYNKVTSQ